MLKLYTNTPLVSSPPGCGAQPATRSQRRRCGMSGRVQSAEPAVRTSLGCTGTAATAARARAHCSARRWSDLTQRRSDGARPTYVRPYSCRILRMAMRQPGPPEVRRSGRRSWIQIPILLLLMKVFYNEAKRGKIGHVRIGIGLRNSGRTSLILQTRGSTGASNQGRTRDP